MGAGPDKAVDLINSMLKSGDRAVRDFDNLSGGAWFGMAPEYWLTTYLARAINEFGKTYALLEVPVKDTLDKAKAIRQGAPKKGERRNGRFDIVTYWGSANSKPRGVVEVKSPICVNDKLRLTPDFVRLSSALSANTKASLQFGAFVFYASVLEPKSSKHDNSKQKLRDLLKRIEDLAKKSAKSTGLTSELYKGSGVHQGHQGVAEEGAWCVAAIIFTRK